MLIQPWLLSGGLWAVGFKDWFLLGSSIQFWLHYCFAWFDSRLLVKLRKMLCFLSTVEILMTGFWIACDLATFWNMFSIGLSLVTMSSLNCMIPWCFTQKAWPLPCCLRCMFALRRPKKGLAAYAEVSAQNMAQVSDVVRGELSTFKDAHSALGAEISGSVTAKVTEFSEQVNEHLQRVEASLEKVLDKGEGSKAEGRKTRADRG